MTADKAVRQLETNLGTFLDSVSVRWPMMVGSKKSVYTYRPRSSQILSERYAIAGSSSRMYL